MVSLTAPTLTDGTVTLRAHRREDAERCWEQCVDPLSREWTTVPLDYTRAMATQFVTVVMAAGWEQDVEWGFAIEVDGRFGGTVSLRREDAGRAEIAFGAHPDVRGTGAVGRALRLLVDWGFGTSDGGPGLEVVEWRAHVGNWASRKAAWRLGFALEGTLRKRLAHRDGLRDAWVATLLRDDPREPATPWLQVPDLDAEGLRLRPWRDADVPRIVEACSDAETQAWLGQVPAPYDEAAARAWLASVTEDLASGRGTTWAVVDPADPAHPDRALASVGWFGLEPGVEAEVGWWAHPDARGRGVVTRAARRVVDHALETQGLARVKAFAATGNTASQRVAEACGMTRTGVERLATRVRDGWADVALYDVLAAEWEAGRGAGSAVERRASSSDQTRNPMPATDSAAPTSAGER